MRQTNNRMNHRVSELQRSYGRIVRPRRQNKRGLLGFLLPFILLLAFVAGRASVARAGELPDHSEAYRYRAVKIQVGDKLDDFATRYNRGLYRSDDSYLEELCRVNHIDRNTRLYPGCFLTVLEAVEE